MLKSSISQSIGLVNVENHFSSLFLSPSNPTCCIGLMTSKTTTSAAYPASVFLGAASTPRSGDRSDESNQTDPSSLSSCAPAATGRPRAPASDQGRGGVVYLVLLSASSAGSCTTVNMRTR